MHQLSGNHWRGRLGVGLLLLLALVATACGGGTGSDAVPSPTSSSTTTTLLPVTTVTTVPPPTTTTVPAATTTTVPALPAVALVPGDTGENVEALQLLLAEHGFFRDAADGVFGGRTAAAVVAFHKATDAERTPNWQEADWPLLATWQPPELPVREGQPDRIEIDLTRQLLYLVGGDTVAVIPVSSGNGETYANSVGRLVRAVTPRGDFSLYKHYDGWRISYLGGLYRPWYFRGGYAIHGSESVPPYPASHGCVRVPIWEADFLFDTLSLGLPVHVWD